MTATEQGYGTPGTNGSGESDAFSEIGYTGLKISGGVVQEEYLPALQGQRGVKAYTEMADTDPIIGGLLYAIGMELRRAQWAVEPGDLSPQADEDAEFLRECMDDMSHTWDSHIADATSMVQYGWSYFETCYKLRQGFQDESALDAPPSSNYNDGKLGWRKFAIRGHETLTRWWVDPHGGIKAMVQTIEGEEVPILIQKSLLYRTSHFKNNPEGRSALRTAYRAWFYKKRDEEQEAIGIERDTTGIPKIRVPGEITDPDATAAQRNTLQQFIDMGANLRRDEQAFVLLPSDKDEITGEFLYDIELMGSPGAASIDIGGVIERYARQEAMSVLGDVILIGHENVGSNALTVTKADMFTTGLQAWLNELRTVQNRFAVPRLFRLNGVTQDVRPLPQFTTTPLDRVDINRFMGAVKAFADAGAPLFPDIELENHIRRLMDLPERDPDMAFDDDMPPEPPQRERIDIGADDDDEVVGDADTAAAETDDSNATGE